MFGFAKSHAVQIKRKEAIKSGKRVWQKALREGGKTLTIKGMGKDLHRERGQEDLHSEKGKMALYKSKLSKMSIW